MKNQHVALLILLVFGTLLTGIVRSGLADSPPVVADILKKVEATYQQTQAFTATFQQSVTSAAVSTARTPGAASAAVVSMETMRAWACVLRTNARWRMPR